MWRDRNNRVHLAANEARGGEVVLRTRRRRMIFLAGLLGAALLALVVMALGLAR